MKLILDNEGKAITTSQLQQELPSVFSKPYPANKLFIRFVDFDTGREKILPAQILEKTDEGDFILTAIKEDTKS